MITPEIIKAVQEDMRGCFGKDSDYFSSTRDVFNARLQSYSLETRQYLTAAVVGEIGNNTFDHNLVFAPGCPEGVYCNLKYRQNYIVLADYGQGIKESLRRVLPGIKDDVEALEMAFVGGISGRAPERRGNGLKFVADSIQRNHWHLFFQSRRAHCLIDPAGLTFFESAAVVGGCLIILDFNEGRRV